MFGDVLTGRALCDQVRLVSRSAERAEAVQILTLADWHREQGWLLDGLVTGASWLVQHQRMLRKDAARLMKMAKLCATHPFIAKALAAGDITVGHVYSIAQQHTAVRAQHLTRDEHVIVDLARDASLAVDEFAVAMRRWANNVDDEVGADPAVAKQRRGLHISRTLNGYRIDGDLTIEEGIKIETAIAKVADKPDPKDRPGGPRTPAQRRHDALALICEHFMACENERAGSPVFTVNCVIDLDQFEETARWFAEQDDADSATTAAEPDDDVATVDAIVRETDDRDDLPQPSTSCLPIGPPMTRRDLLARRDVIRPNGEAIPIRRAMLERLLCTSHLARVIMRGPSVLLDLSRRTRLFTAAQEHAIKLRDGPGCAVGGCANHADVIHHLDPFGEGGPTDLDNGVPLCDHHHDDVHEHRATLTRNADGSYTFSVLRPRKAA